MIKHNKSFSERNKTILTALKNRVSICIDQSSRDSDGIRKNYVTFGGISKKTLVKFYDMISHDLVEEPKDMSILLEYFTYPTNQKVDVPKVFLNFI